MRENPLMFNPVDAMKASLNIVYGGSTKYVRVVPESRIKPPELSDCNSNAVGVMGNAELPIVIPVRFK
jgi:hypothetical protein